MTNADLTWHQLPRDGGQTVDVHYAVDWESGLLYRRSHDRSDGEQTLEQAVIEGGEFEPQNGRLPRVGEWTAVSGTGLRNYSLAYMKADGRWDIVRTFTAANDAAANDWADRNGDGDWYVLNSDGQNINAW